MGVTPPPPPGSLLRGGGSSKGGRDDCGQPHQKPGKSALGTRLDWGGKKMDPFLPLPSPSPVVCFKAGRANNEVSTGCEQRFLSYMAFSVYGVVPVSNQLRDRQATRTTS